MILMGLFIEDIQMYCMRNPQYDLTLILETIVKIDFAKAVKMGPYLKGRSLWCFQTCSESLLNPNDKTIELKMKITDFSINTLKQEKIKSIKLVATRSLVRYARKMKKENLLEEAEKFESILDDLLDLLDSSNKDVMYLPIEAFQTFSKVN